MNALRTLGLLALVAVHLVAGAYAVFGFVLVGADRATYTANTTCSRPSASPKAPPRT